MESKATFSAVADKVGLTGVDKNIFVGYMLTRWSEKDGDPIEYSYIKEWAYRFKNGTGWACSDLEGRAILDELNITLV